MTSPAFESSLAALRDNVVMAVERREMGVVQDGLDVYQHLIEAILDEQLRLQATTASESGPNLPLGREWEQLLRDLHGIIDSVSASTSRLLWVDALSWVRGVAVDCADRGVLNALGNILTLFESAWSQELAAPAADSPARQDALLLRLSEFGSFYLHLQRTDQVTARGANVIYTRTFLQVIKSAIESGDAEAARIAIKYFVHGSSSQGTAKNPVTGAGLLALYAWILYRFDHGEQDASFKAVCSQIASAFQGDEEFIPMLRAADELERELGLHWWEARERGPMSSGVIQIGTYFSLALMLVAGPRLTWEALHPENSDDLGAARRLMTVIDSFEKGSFAGARTALSLPDDHFEQLKAHLRDLIEQGDAISEESYAQLPVDPERVGRFRAAVRQKLAEERKESLTAALLTPASTGEPAETNFGLDTLIPRWYFAETRVLAEPERLASELVRGLVRGEEDRILDLAVGDLSGAIETTLDTLVANLETAVTARQIASPIAVTNSYQAHSILTGRPLSVADASAVTFTAGPVLRAYDDRSAYVALLSPLGLPTVRLLPPATRHFGDEAIDDLHVIIGVSEVPPQDMNEIVSRQERTRIDEARLRGSLRVRLLEHLTISMEPDVRPPIWVLPDSSW